MICRLVQKVRQDMSLRVEKGADWTWPENDPICFPNASIGPSTFRNTGTARLGSCCYSRS